MPRGSLPGERRGGRQKGTPNKATAEVKELAKQYTEKAIRRLADMLDDPNAPPVAVVKAAAELLDRGHGRATQHIEARVGMIEGMTDEDLAHALAVLQAADEREAGEIVGHA